MNRHLKAIYAGEVTKSNVIGIRKAINAFERRSECLSVSRTAPRLAGSEIAQIERALADREPLVVGELHDSGIKLLRSGRYAKRLAPVKAIIDHPGLHFRLVAFDRIGARGLHSVPVYRAHCGGASFLFRNIAWQSGGDGPEVLKICC
jgi:hypothetical protein